MQSVGSPLSPDAARPAASRLDPDRFVAAQSQVWPAVTRELRAGRKASHWMWFVFPQLAGLGRSETARRFAIAGPAEAEAYLAHPLLGARLREAVRLALAAAPGRSAREIFGTPDDLKLRSSLTLFDALAPGDVFAQGLARFFAGPDPETLRLLSEGRTA